MGGVVSFRRVEYGEIFVGALSIRARVIAAIWEDFPKDLCMKNLITSILAWLEGGRVIKRWD